MSEKEEFDLETYPIASSRKQVAELIADYKIYTELKKIPKTLIIGHTRQDRKIADGVLCLDISHLRNPNLLGDITSFNLLVTYPDLIEFFDIVIFLGCEGFVLFDKSLNFKIPTIFNAYALLKPGGRIILGSAVSPFSTLVQVQMNEDKETAEFAAESVFKSTLEKRGFEDIEFVRNPKFERYNFARPEEKDHSFWILTVAKKGKSDNFEKLLSKAREETDKNLDKYQVLREVLFEFLDSQLSKVISEKELSNVVQFL
jgi:hypothetical protein